jgi:hypothetical protein
MFLGGVRGKELGGGVLGMDAIGIEGAILCRSYILAAPFTTSRQDRQRDNNSLPRLVLSEWMAMPLPPKDEHSTIYRPSQWPESRRPIPGRHHSSFISSSPPLTTTPNPTYRSPTYRCLAAGIWKGLSSPSLSLSDERFGIASIAKVADPWISADFMLDGNPDS